MAKKLSFSEIRERVQVAILSGRAGDSIWIRDLYEDEVVYEEVGKNGLDGKSYKCSYTLDSDGNVSLGQAVEVVQTRTYEPVVQFSRTAAGSYVGKVFEIGDFPDKRFSLSSNEADAAIAGFSPVPLNLEHMPTVLNGELGDLKKIWRDGSTIFGEMEVPGWFKEAFGDKVKASLEWNASKSIEGCAIVENPRIEDAELVAAFSSRAGIELRKSKPMNAWDKFLAIFKKSAEESGILEGSISTFRQDDGELRRLREENEAIKATQAQVESSLIDQAAANFAADAIKGTATRKPKALPAEEAQLVQLFKSFAKLDSSEGTKFSAGEGTHVKALREMIASRADIDLTGDAKGEPAVLFAKGTSAPAKPEIDTLDIYESRAKAMGGSR